MESTLEVLTTRKTATRERWTYKPSEEPEHGKRRPCHTLTKKLATNSSAAAMMGTAASRRQLRSD